MKKKIIIDSDAYVKEEVREPINRNQPLVNNKIYEWLIYMVGYSQKQVASYMHKLNKEIKKLPYEYGAEFGYSMILDDLKSVEDAMNEATEEMKKQKKEKKNEKEEKE